MIRKLNETNRLYRLNARGVSRWGWSDIRFRKSLFDASTKTWRVEMTSGITLRFDEDEMELA